MPEIINLQEHRPHMAGTARCMNCKHEWVAVAPQGTATLDCPECECWKGVWKGACLSEAKDLWTCKCGNEYFVIHIDRIMCANCGESQHGMFG